MIFGDLGMEAFCRGPTDTHVESPIPGNNCLSSDICPISSTARIQVVEKVRTQHDSSKLFCFDSGRPGVSCIRSPSLPVQYDLALANNVKARHYGSSFLSKCPKLMTAIRLSVHVAHDIYPQTSMHSSATETTSITNRTCTRRNKVTVQKPEVKKSPAFLRPSQHSSKSLKS